MPSSRRRNRLRKVEITQVSPSKVRDRGWDGNLVVLKP